ncbi:helix-turn-helix domain-containing protein [Niabella aurantiaca]|uniref:helix-turn-helix domain-containing protein n=1 Tax=Niabella aurantiaca TaxID=379900 RepID=UPI00037618AC|nr:helix-turn-helix domain-containing protein [Niabella aurantiaca]
MKQLNIEQRLEKIEEEIASIKKALERVLNKPQALQATGNEPEIMTVKQLAQFTGIDENMIYANCAKGDIPYFKLGKQYRFKKKEIQEWLKEQKGAPEFSVDQYVDRYLQKNVLKA